jgi:hypothetical protein
VFSGSEPLSLISRIPELVGSGGAFQKEKFNPVPKVDKLTNQGQQPQEDVPAGGCGVLRFPLLA